MNSILLIHGHFPVQTATRFSTLKWRFQNHFTTSLTCNRENNTSSIDTVCLAGLVEDHKTLVACLAFLSWEHTCPVSCLATLSFSSSCLLETIFFGLFATSDTARFSGHVDTSAQWTGKEEKKILYTNSLKSFWYFICNISYSTSWKSHFWSHLDYLLFPVVVGWPKSFISWMAVKSVQINQQVFSSVVCFFFICQSFGSSLLSNHYQIKRCICVLMSLV